MANNRLLIGESIWFDQAKFEAAEARYQQIIAERHSSLKVEGKAISKSSSAISTELEKAMNFIGQSLKVPPQSSAGKGDLEARVSALEKENKELKSALVSLTLRVSSLECKLGGEMKQQQPSTEQTDKDDDFDLFGSEDESDEEVEKLKEQRLQQYGTKKTKKGVVAKSNIILDVKPWDDETDVVELEKAVRSVSTDGLVWGASKLVPVAYGIKKLQITCVVEDEKVGTDFLEESITSFEDYVQSVDIVAFNKI